MLDNFSIECGSEEYRRKIVSEGSRLQARSVSGILLRMVRLKVHAVEIPPYLHSV